MRRTRAVAFLTLALSITAAATAHAGITAVAPADSDGPNESFTDNQALWAIGESDALAGSGQLCVIPAGRSAGDCKTDADWGRPNVIGSEGFYQQPIVAAPLPPGHWRILADNGEDAQDIVSAPFDVDRCTAGDCSNTIAHEQLQEWKDTASGMRDGLGLTCLALTIHDNTSPGKALELGGAILGTGVRETIVAQIKGDAIDVFKPESTEDKAIDLLRRVSCGAFVMEDDIVADPADPDYKHLSSPAPELIESSGDGLADSAARRLEAMRAEGVSERVDSERYQGAVAAGDDAWSSLQAGRIGSAGLDLSHDVRHAGAELRAASLTVDASATHPAAGADQIAHARAVRERIRTAGFTTDETGQMHDLGLTDAEIVQAREQLGAPLPAGTTGQAPADALITAADAIEHGSCAADGDACGFDTFARTAAAVGANTAVTPNLSAGDAVLREGDRGVAHLSLPFELSAPSEAVVSAHFEIADPDAHPRVRLAVSDIGFAAGETRAAVSLVWKNDAAPQADETVEITGSASGADFTGPVTVTLHDDGDGGAAHIPRRQGLVAFSDSAYPFANPITFAPDSGGPLTYVAEPAGTDADAVFQPFERLIVEDWSHELMLFVRVALDAQDQANGGQAFWTAPVDERGRPTAPPTRVTAQLGLGNGGSLSPDARRLAYGTFSDSDWHLEIQALDAAGHASGAPVPLAADPHLAGWEELEAEWAPDGAHLAFSGCPPAGADCGVFVVPIDGTGHVTADPVTVISGPNDNTASYRNPSWSPDGHFLAYVGQHLGDNGISFFTVERRRVTAGGTPSGGSDAIGRFDSSLNYSPAWRPDSRGIAYITDRDPVGGQQAVTAVSRVLDANALPAGPPVTLNPLGGGPVSLAWGSAARDTVAPASTATVTPPPNAAGWHRGDAKVTVKATDAFSGVTSITIEGKRTTGDHASVTVHDEGSRLLHYFATDEAGNAGTPHTLAVRIDRTPPVVHVSAPGEGAAVPHGAALSAAYSCTDAVSGIARCTGDRPSGAALDTATAGARAFSAGATDIAGNATSVLRSWSVLPAAGGPPPVVTKPPAAATLPSNKRCVSRRKFRIRLAKLAGDPVRRAEVTLNGRRVKVVKGARLRAPVDLRGLPKGKVKVKVTLRTASGRRLTSSRTYHTCVPKRRSRG